MNILSTIIWKLVPKNLMRKAVGKHFQKAAKVDCGIFAQAAKGKKDDVMKKEIGEFIEQAGSTEVSFLDLMAKNSLRGYTLTPYKGGSKTLELVSDKLHKNTEIGPSILKDLLG